MPIVTKTKTLGKCRKWEKNRRQRMCAAFSALGAALPSQSPPCTQILILEHALAYIRQLQTKTADIAQKAQDSMHDTPEVEVSELRQKCWQLVQRLLQARLPLPPPPALPRKEVDPPNGAVEDVKNQVLKNETNVADQKGKNVQEIKPKKKHKKQATDAIDKSIDNTTNKENVEIVTKEGEKAPEKSELNVEQVDSTKVTECGETSDKIKKKMVPKKPVMNRKHTRKKKNTKPGIPVTIGPSTTMLSNTPNVWVANGGLRGPVMVGSNLVPLLPLAPPLLHPAPLPAPPTIFLLQRNHSDQISINNFPLVAAPNKRKIYSNIYGFDVTKTTMVNKVPISAFSTSSSLGKGKGISKNLRLPRVTQRSRQRVVKLAKMAKNIEKDQTSSENKKEEQTNEQTQNSNSQTNTSSSNIIKDTENKIISNENKLVDSQVEASKINVETNVQSSVTSNENTSKGGNCESTQAVKKDDKDSKVEPSLASEHKENISNTLFLSSCNMLESVNKINTNPEASEILHNVENPKDSIAKKRKLQEAEETIEEIKTNNVVNESMNIMNSDCRLSNVKNVKDSEVSISGNDIGEELWGPGAPLPTSPLPSSPTAAFLLAFPLVSHGPRPDTPLYDNLQTPNICSMDHFSNFFSSKESSSVATVPVTQSNNVLLDNHLRSLPALSEITKSNWSLPHNNLNFQKSTPPSKSDILGIYNAKSNVNSSKNVPADKDIVKDPVSTSSACVYSDAQNIFQNVKPVISSGNYCLSESIFNYEHVPVMNNIKSQKSQLYSHNNKTPFHFDNLTPDMSDKAKVVANDNNLYSYIGPTFPNTTPMAFDNEKIQKNIAPLTFASDTVSCKKLQTRDNSAKVPSLGGVASECSSVPKSLDITFPHPPQSKATVFSNSSNVFTSCNTYNPFTPEFTSNSTWGVSNMSSNNQPRSKTSNMYFPEFSTNIYTQSCNLWPDDVAASGNEFLKPEYTKKCTSTVSASHNYQMPPIVTDSQSDFRYPFSVIPKTSNIKPNNPSDLSKGNKNVSVISGSKDTKYVVQENKSVKSDYSIQKGLVNWMTSEVGHGQDMFLPYQKEYNKDAKHNNLHGAVLPNANQYPADQSIPVPNLPSNLGNRKTDMYEQPFYMPSGGYMPQTFGDDNQFTWSPSKLVPIAESAPIVPCSLPTLVGDLALGIGETKQTYQLFLDQPDAIAVKDRKNLPSKTKPVMNKTSNSHSDIHSSNSAGNFLSVSQIMDRGKQETIIQENTDINKTPYKYIETQKKNIPAVDSQVKNLNVNLPSINKPYSSHLDGSHCGSVPLFPAEVFPMQQMTEYFAPLPSKDVHYNNKLELKNVQKNNYSTESLLQTSDIHCQNNNKNKNSTVAKFYDASNLCIPANLNGNQHNSSSNSVQYDNISHNQSNITNYPYPVSSMPVNTSFYSAPSYITSSSTMNSNYINNFFPPKLENCRSKVQNDIIHDASKFPNNNNSKVNSSKEVIGKHKSDHFKKEILPKRQKKAKNPQIDSYTFSSQERYNSSIANASTPSMGYDDSFFGYFSSSQMHPYPSQSHPPPPPPPPLSHTTAVMQGNQKTGNSSKLRSSSSPNSAGTSLTNFNLSTIFPEINKRPSMPGFQDPQHSAPQTAKPPVTLFQ